MTPGFFRTQVAVLSFSLTICLGFSGCNPNPSNSTEASVKTATTKEIPQESSEVTVKEVNADELNQALNSYKGHVVVVDFWATWCAPCVKKFPHMIDLHKQFASRGLICISVSMDALEREAEYKADNGKEKVLKFLKTKKATFPNFIIPEPAKEEKAIYSRFGQLDAGIPYLAIFDKAGRRVWDDNQTALSATEFDKKIVELLDQ